jgi:hypothetical protein
MAHTRILIICASITLCLANNVHCANIENTKNQEAISDQSSTVTQLIQQESQNTALIEFYKANPWLYLEKTLIEEPYAQKNALYWTNFFKKIGAFFGTYAAVMTTALLFTFLTPSSTNNHEPCILVPAAIIGIVLGIIVSKRIGNNKDIDVNTLKQLLNEYSTIFNKELPQELQKCIAEMHDAYLKYNDTYLEHEGLDVLYEIRNCIEHKFPEKYYRPIINTYVSTYSFTSVNPKK